MKKVYLIISMIALLTFIVLSILTLFISSTGNPPIDFWGRELQPSPLLVQWMQIDYYPGIKWFIIDLLIAFSLIVTSKKCFDLSEM